MTVPVQNIYYLLCYAWDHVKEGETIDVGSEEFGGLVDLFGKVLNAGVSRLVSRGLDRDYRVVQEDIRGLKGKLDLAVTIKRNLLLNGKTHCTFDDFNYDVPQNRILKATLRRLTLVRNFDPALRLQSEHLYHKLDAVSDVPLTASLFRTVRVHRNNRFYSFLLHLCQVIRANLLVNQEDGIATFYDFREDEQKMGMLFQQFVRTFLDRNTSYEVSAPKLNWIGAETSPSGLRNLPRMETDIVLETGERTIIVDTKFYKDPLITWHGGTKVRSAHLYQIFSYTTNWPARGTNGNDRTEGWLLYAAVDRDFDYRYNLAGRSIRVCSIDLAQDWMGIEGDLKRLVSV